MPKTKIIDDSSSDSDSSGPRDRNPPKKAKSEGTSTSSKSSGASGGGSKSKGSKDNTWPLDKNRSVTINEFRGKVLVDIREYYQDKDGDTKPGKRGISLSASQWQKLKEAIPEIDEALKNH